MFTCMCTRIQSIYTTHLGDVYSWLALPKDPASMVHSSNDTQPKDTNTAVQDHSLWVLDKVSEGEKTGKITYSIRQTQEKLLQQFYYPRGRERGCNFEKR